MRYFDYAATTPCEEGAAALAQSFASENFGNPSSTHALGETSARAIHQSRKIFAKAFEVKPEQVIFTGSGTEANNLAIQGIVVPQALTALRSRSNSRPRVLTTSIEHPATLATIESLKDYEVEVAVIPVQNDGSIDEPTLLALLTPNTVLVSMMCVNNIVGAILPVDRLAKLAKQKLPGVLVHCDAIQAFGKVTVPTAASSIDLLSLSAHKISGPKGIGALVVLNPNLLQPGILRPLVFGGGQEHGLRSGTPNAGLISAFGSAAENILKDLESNTEKLKNLCSVFRSEMERAQLIGKSEQDEFKVFWNSPIDHFPGIVSISVSGVPTQALAKLLEREGFLVATGSACSSGKATKDRVLQSLGFSQMRCESPLRISFSPCHQEGDIKDLVQAIKRTIQKVQGLFAESSSIAFV